MNVRHLVLATTLLLAAAPLAHADRVTTTIAPRATPKDRHRIAHVVGIAAGATAYVVWEGALKDSLAPKTCRWCSVPGFDDGVREALVWGTPKTANSLANLTGYALAPLGAAGLLLVAARDRDDQWTTWGDDLIAITEAALYGQLVVQGFKYGVGRQRPYAHYAPGGTEYASTNDDNLSFVSGHSALAFSLATAAGVVAHERGYTLEPVIWASGMTVAALTGYFRIAADKHYFSDVLGGAAVGVAAGLLIPRLTGSLPDNTRVVPTGNGVALAGTF